MGGLGCGRGGYTVGCVIYLGMLGGGGASVLRNGHERGWGCAKGGFKDTAYIKCNGILFFLFYT